MSRLTVVIPCPDRSIGRGENRSGLHEVVLGYASADDAIAAMEVSGHASVQTEPN